MVKKDAVSSVFGGPVTPIPLQGTGTLPKQTPLPLQGIVLAHHTTLWYAQGYALWNTTSICPSGGPYAGSGPPGQGPSLTTNTPNSQQHFHIYIVHIYIIIRIISCYYI